MSVAAWYNGRIIVLAARMPFSARHTAVKEPFLRC